MAIRFSNQISDYLVSGSYQDSRLFHVDTSDQIQVWAPQVGQGYIQEIPLREDLSLVILDYTMHKTVLMNLPRRQKASLNFEFQLAGAIPKQSSFKPHIGPASLDVWPAQQHQFRVEIVFGLSSLITYYQRIAERLSPQALTSFNKFIELSYFSLFCNRADSPQAALNQILIHTHISPPSVELITERFLAAPELLGSRLTVEQSMTAEMYRIIEQILSCPYHGRVRRTYLEHKALDLVSLKLNSLEQWRNPSYPLKLEDLDGIQQASQILARQLQTPPSIESLARQVGLNRLKLNQGFHHIYGTTPFRYLRTCRLELAFHLLFASDLAVEEIAYRVGYTNRSRFTSAFRKQFGLNPKFFQLQLDNIAYVS
ncbi:MAG: AraC family transcriptional regulator [Cyanobacteria bacterium P01_B01_bin.77]